MVIELNQASLSSPINHHGNFIFYTVIGFTGVVDTEKMSHRLNLNS